MQYRNFGKLGIKASAFGLGCMRFPMKEQDGKQVVDEDLATAIIRTAIDGGVTYVDTAYVYSGGQNESVVGRALRDGYREKVNLATKLPTWACNTPEDLPRLFEEQCRALQTDHIDFYLVHALAADKWEKMKSLGIRAFLDKLKKEGKIRYACFSFHDSYEVFEKILSEYDWDMCQIQFNIVDINNQAGLRGLKLAGEKGIPVVIMEGLRGGNLANVPPQVQAVYDSYPVKRSPAEWAFRWLCNFPQVATVLSGVTSLEQTRDNLRIFDELCPGILIPEEETVIDRAREAWFARNKIGCTGCRYCMPCPNGVDIPGIFRVWNDAYTFSDHISGNGQYAGMAREGHGAAACVGCGRCEGLCPQHLPIIEALKNADSELR